MYVRYQLTRVLLGLLFLALAPVQVSAATTISNDAAFGRFMSTTVGAGQTSVSYGSTGVPLASPSASTLGTDGGSFLNNTRTGAITNPSANPVQVTGTGKYSGAKLAPVLGKALKILPVLGTGIAIYDLFKEVGMDPAKNPDGSINYRKVDPNVCTVAPCYKYEVRVYSGTGLFFPTKFQACDAGLQRYRVAQPSYQFVYLSSDTTCNFRIMQGATVIQSVASETIFATSTAPSPVAYLPSSEQEFADAIALKSGWPTSSALAKAVADAVELTGDTITPDSVTVTGPATSTGPAKTVVNPDGSKTVTTPTYGHTYNNNTVTTVTTTTINNYNSSNVLQSTTTQTESPTPPQTDCQIDPSIVGCAHLDTPVSASLKTKNHAVTVTAVPFASSSVCPSPLSFTVRGSSYGVSYQSLCDRLALLRTLFLALAGVLAAFIVADSFRVQ